MISTKSLTAKCLLIFFFCTNFINAETVALEVSYKITDDWNEGYKVGITIQNLTASLITSWKVSFYLENKMEKIGSSFGGIFTQNGSLVEITSGNSRINTNEHITFYFNVNGAETAQNSIRVLQNLKALGAIETTEEYKK